MTRRTPFRIPAGYQPTAAEQRVMTHTLRALSAEIAVLSQDGIPPRAIVVALLMSAVRVTANTQAFPATDLRGMFDAIMDQYTMEDEA